MSPQRPVDYPPPVHPGEFVGEPVAAASERLSVGVLIVGAGPGGLACAIRLIQLLADTPALTESLGEVPVAVLEKGRNVGSHLLSGAVIDAAPLRALFPNADERDWPTYGVVEREAVYLMTAKHALALPRVPPPFRNHGNHVVSLARLGRWLGGRAEDAGVYLLAQTAGQKLLVKDGAVRGVRTGDKGRGREGEPLSNFLEGSELHASVTVLAEGTQGHLSLAAIDRFGLHGPNPQGYELAVKEVWEIPRPLDRVIHTMGWPLRYAPRFREFGGGFIYPMGERMVSLGLVVGLDYRDATLSVHDLLQQFKTHPSVAAILEGGRRIAWGAKTIPSGGYWAMPKRLWAPGMVMLGDAASMVNVPRLKGVHLAISSGMLAAEAIFRTLQDDSTDDLSRYEQAVRSSAIERELYRSRNMRQPFAKGFLPGALAANAMELTGGRFPAGRWRAHSDAQADMFIGERSYPKADGKLTFDKLSSVFSSGNATRDDAPNHIRIQQRVPLSIGLAWQHMCPAGVYEVPEHELQGARSPDGTMRPDALVQVTLTPANCVQCGATTAKGGRLTPAEGGDGPNYQLT